MLKIDWNLVFNMINIIVFYLLMKKFLFKPVTEVMEKRRNSINATLEEARKEKEDAEQSRKKYEDILTNAEGKADQIILEAKQTAIKEFEAQINEAKTETLRLIEAANHKIELDQKEAFHKIQNEIADLAILTASKIIQQNITDKTNDIILNDFLSEAGVDQ